MRTKTSFWLTLRSCCFVTAALMIAACSGPETKPDSVVNPSSRIVKFDPARADNELGRNEHFVVIMALPDDTSRSLAERYYRDSSLYWLIEDANPGLIIETGAEVIVPLNHVAPLGVSTDRVQSVPILAYHGFGDGDGKLTISSSKFEEQMEYLLLNDYRVITLAQFIAFLEGQGAIPERSVMITIDDGHASTYHIAFPILQKYGFPATVFPYAEYISNGGVSWGQLLEMERSGLIDVQLHSQSHADLTVREQGESLPELRKRLEREIQLPMQLFRERLDSDPYTMAYPYGATNEHVVERWQSPCFWLQPLARFALLISIRFVNLLLSITPSWQLPTDRLQSYGSRCANGKSLMH